MLGKSLPSMQVIRDRRLVRRMLAGDERAYQAFVDEYFPKLYRYAFHRLREHQMVEDVIQEALAKAARRIETFRGESTLLTWLTRICRHEISRLLSRNERYEDTMLPYLNDDILCAVVESIESTHQYEPDALCQRNELVSLIQFALDQLPEHYALALEMKYIEGRSSREIAACLEIGDDAAQSLLARARQAFREVGETAIGALLDNGGAGTHTSGVATDASK